MKPSCACSYSGTYDDAILGAISAAGDVPPLVARALVRRGVTDAAAVRAFLHPSLSELLDPMSLPDMAAAVDRLRRAIAGGERICVYGDYDADGVCATAILVDCLRRLQANVFYYIPSRHDEGYGMHPEAVEQLAGLGTQLIVTVDNGIAAVDEAALCTRLGLDLIITDHHLPPERLPEAVAVVSASRQDARYGNRALCGAGVAYQLACALAPSLEHAGWLALAAVATVSDVVPLTGENRVLVACGLPHVAGNVGLLALLQGAGHAGKAVTAETVAFLIAPRLNAAGRMGDASRAAELLLERDCARAQALAAELEMENHARRAEEQRILTDIAARLASEGVEEPRSLALHGDDWHLGVIGIVASRLCEQYHCPVLLFGRRDGLLIGSCRSVPGINLHECLQHFAGCFMQFGGHARAAGITMRPEQFAPFAAAFDAYVRERFDEASLPVDNLYEEDVALDELTLPAVRALQQLAPFGEGNPEPVYRIRRATLSDVRQIGQQGAHLAAMARQGDTRMRAVGFRLGARAGSLCRFPLWTLLATPKINGFSGTDAVELQLVEALPYDVLKVLRAFLTKVLYNTVADCDTLCEVFFLSHGYSVFRMLPVGAEELRRLYAGLRREMGQAGVAVSVLGTWTSEPALWALCLFLELGFFRFDAESQRVLPVEHPEKRSLEDSVLYRMALPHAAPQ